MKILLRDFLKIH